MDVSLGAPGRVQHLTWLNAASHPVCLSPAAEAKGTNRRAWPLVGGLAPCAVANLLDRCSCAWVRV